VRELENLDRSSARDDGEQGAEAELRVSAR
jgi:hypothetical protein